MKLATLFWFLPFFAESRPETRSFFFYCNVFWQSLGQDQEELHCTFSQTSWGARPETRACGKTSPTRRTQPTTRGDTKTYKKPKPQAVNCLEKMQLSYDKGTDLLSLRWAANLEQQQTPAPFHVAWCLFAHGKPDAPSSNHMFDFWEVLVDQNGAQTCASSNQAMGLQVQKRRSIHDVCKFKKHSHSHSPFNLIRRG